MRVVVLGANGRTGKELVKLAAAAGHQITAVTRHPEAAAASPNIKYVKAGIYDGDELASVFKGHEAVLSTLGNNKSRPIEASSRAIIAGMQTSGVKRLVVELAFGAAESARLTFLFRIMNELYLGKVLADQRAGVRLITQTGLDWTVFFATVLQDWPLTKKYRVVPSQEKINWNYRISRADVAQAMLDAVTTNTYIRKLAVISGA
jgi:putative NADH-flavin reductase